MANFYAYFALALILGAAFPPKVLTDGGEADATAAGFASDQGILHEFGKAGEVGAEAEVGKTTGAGVKATLGDIGVNLANAVGGKLGLSADTGISVGTKTQLKLLGTGFKIDFTKGVEFCVVGSCIIFGTPQDEAPQEGTPEAKAEAAAAAKAAEK